MMGDAVRCARNRVRNHWAALFWFAVALLTVFVSSGCRRGGPITGASPVSAEGTISGTVRGPGQVAAIQGRTVEVVSLETNERQRVTTNSAGGFTVKVKPGKYRVELTLRHGEALLRQPGIMNVNRSDLDAHADFLVGARESRPRGAGTRTDISLGSPRA